MASSLLRQKPSESLPNVLWIMRFPTLSGRNRNYYWPCMSSECCSLWSFAMVISPTLLSFLPCQCLLVPSWRLKRDPHSGPSFCVTFFSLGCALRTLNTLLAIPNNIFSTQNVYQVPPGFPISSAEQCQSSSHLIPISQR